MVSKLLIEAMQNGNTRLVATSARSLVKRATELNRVAPSFRHSLLKSSVSKGDDSVTSSSSGHYKEWTRGLNEKVMQVAIQLSTCIAVRTKS